MFLDQQDQRKPRQNNREFLCIEITVLSVLSFFTDCEFNIQLYDNDTLASKGMNRDNPVIIYVKKDGKKLAAYCSGGDEVHPKEMVRATPEVASCYRSTLFIERGEEVSPANITACKTNGLIGH